MFLCALLVVSNGCAAFHSLGPVFIAATPDHWCEVDKGDFDNCTGENLKAITIPKEQKDGEMVYSQCTVYSHNTSFFDSSEYCAHNNSEMTWNSSQFSKTRYCDEWEYSTEYFTKTIVNEVRIAQYLSLFWKIFLAFYWVWWRGHINVQLQKDHHAWMLKMNQV